MANEPDALVVWALSAFHTAFLVTVLVTLAYVSTPLGSLLQGLDTIIGLAVYLVLWAVSWLTTRTVLRRVSLLEGASLTAVLAQGLFWGAITGVSFLLGVVLITLIPQLLLRGEFGAIVFLTTIGSVVALVIGAVVGGLFALLDVFFFWTAELVMTE